MEVSRVKDAAFTAMGCLFVAILVCAEVAGATSTAPPTPVEHMTGWQRVFVALAYTFASLLVMGFCVCASVLCICCFCNDGNRRTYDSAKRA